MSRFLLIEEAVREEKRLSASNKRRKRQEHIILPLPNDYSHCKDYRLTASLLEQLFHEIIPLLPPKKNSRGIDPTVKIMTALHFYARGSYQHDVGANAPMSQQSVSKCIREVTFALNDSNVVNRHIQFPQNSVQRNIIKRGFYEKYGIAGVCGCIDCTHVAIIRPKDNEERFFNRKNYHSLNVQMICDENNKLLNVDARYGGATHDSFIWSQSMIKSHFEVEALVGTGEQALLLGDSGYPLREYMMVPIGSPANHAEVHFNSVQKKARATIERTFGILKGRWRCLLAARELSYTPEMAGKIVIACSVLHNICVEAALDPLELTEEERLQETERQPPVLIPAPISGIEGGRRVRNAILHYLCNRNPPASPT